MNKTGFWFWFLTVTHVYPFWKWLLFLEDKP